MVSGCDLEISEIALMAIMGQDSVVSIATHYGLEGPEIESWLGEIFHTYPDCPWGTPSLLYDGYRVFIVGKAAGAWRWSPTPI
jgi:hypothetical protein